MDLSSPVGSCTEDYRSWPSQDELDALASIGCDFGCAPWAYGPGSPHYGPPTSCKNHKYPTCPSQNPYYKTPSTESEFLVCERPRPPSPISFYLAPITHSKTMKKKAAKRQNKRTGQRASAKNNETAFNMQAIREALNSNGPAPTREASSSATISDELSTLLGQMRLNKPSKNRQASRKNKRTHTKHKKKRGGRRTRK